MKLKWKSKKEYLTKSSKVTEKLGEKLSKEVTQQQLNLSTQAIILGLIGDLGSGKTTFLKGFAKGLGIKEKILSPTFIIMKKFSLSHFRFRNFYHFDCYRIEDSKELLTLGFKEIISDPQNIVCLEWSEKIKKILPKNSFIIHFIFIDPKTRKITIEKF